MRKANYQERGYNRFLLISRCEVVSNLYNGLKVWEPLPTVLAFAFPQIAQG